MVAADDRYPQPLDFYLFPLRPCFFELYCVYRCQYIYTPGSDSDLEHSAGSFEISGLYLV